MIFDIVKKEDSSISYTQITDLLHLSFQERIEQGMFFTCSSLSPNEYENRCNGKNDMVFVAIDCDTKALLGTICVHIKTDYNGQIYGYVEYLAVLPKVKHCGLGRALLNKITDCVKEVGGIFILSDTAIGAKSSIKCHKKCGYMIIGLRSYKTTNYYSYLLRKQLSSPSPWNNSIYVGFKFFISAVKTLLFTKSDGSYTCFGQLIH